MSVDRATYQPNVAARKATAPGSDITPTVARGAGPALRHIGLEADARHLQRSHNLVNEVRLLLPTASADQALASFRLQTATARVNNFIMHLLLALPDPTFAGLMFTDASFCFRNGVYSVAPLPGKMTGMAGVSDDVLPGAAITMGGVPDETSGEMQDEPPGGWLRRDRQLHTIVERCCGLPRGRTAADVLTANYSQG